MRYRNSAATFVCLIGLPACHAAAGVEKVRNAKVVVVEELSLRASRRRCRKSFPA